MSVPRLYADLAHLWPVLSPPEDYAPEAAMVAELLDAHAGVSKTSGEISGGRTLLELGVGGGHTLSHLADRYECFAVDRSPAMLAQCRQLIPHVPTVEGDMRDVRLGRAFDAVLIHDAIDYLTTPDDVRRTLATVTAHLHAPGTPGIPGVVASVSHAPGGLALIAPTYTTETFTDGETEHDAHAGFAYDAVVRRTGEHTFDLLLTYHVAGETIEDVHHCGLFSRRFWLHEMCNAGLAAEHIPNDLWELFTGVRVR